jgi:type II secretory pathway predicted ATPase ExeA
MPDNASHSLFPASPRPDQAVAHPAWQAALAGIKGSLSKPGLVAIIGAPGTGKTLLLHAVAERVLASGGVAALFQPAPVAGSRRPDVVLIDDAGRLTASMLKALAQQGRPVVVAGGPDLAVRLRGAGVPATVVTLGLLAPDDAVAFLKAQLAAAERPVDLIQPAALMQLVQRSQGVPRDLQMLAGLSVFVARLADAPQVTPAHVEQAALIQTGTEPGDDDPDGEEDGPALPVPAQPQSAKSSAAKSPAAKPPVAKPLAAQPTLAQMLPAELQAASANAGRGIAGWTLAALALGALAAGAGVGWLLVPYASPWLLARGAPGPAKGTAPSRVAGNPQPATPRVQPGPAAPPSRAAVASLGALPPASPRLAVPPVAAPPVIAEAPAAPPLQAQRPSQPAPGQPAPPPAVAASVLPPDPGVPNQHPALVAAAPQPEPPAAPEPLPAPPKQAPPQQSLATPVPAATPPALPESQPPASPAEAAPQLGQTPASPASLASPASPPQLVRPAAIQMLPLPPAATLHVIVLYDAGTADAGGRADSLVEELGRQGYAVPPPEPGAVRGEPAVSYAFAEDAPAATALAHAIGVEATQVRVAADPRPGTIRVAVTPATAGRTVINLQPTGSRR